MIRSCILLSCALLLAACTRSLTVASTLSLPARAPVFVFPSVWVAGGKYEEEVYLLDRIAAQLARDPRREVRRVRADELEPARQAGEISFLTAVVQLSLSLRSSERTHTALMPMTYCGPFGCGLTSYSAYSQYIPIMTGEVVLTVHEGPTARVLSRETFSETIEGDVDEVLRPELIERLADQLLRGVDIHMQQVAFKLHKTDIRAADDGIASLAVGKYKEGRALLEGAAKSLGGEKKQIQARVWHALGVARLFAPDPGDDDLADALRALRLAHKTDPRRHYEQSIERVEGLAKQVAVLAEQRRAAAHNFQLAQELRKSLPPTAPPAKTDVLPLPKLEAPPAPTDAGPNASKAGTKTPTTAALPVSATPKAPKGEPPPKPEGQSPALPKPDAGVTNVPAANTAPGDAGVARPRMRDAGTHQVDAASARREASTAAGRKTDAGLARDAAAQ